MPKTMTRKQIVEILKLHDGCLIYRDEEYTKLESKFYKLRALSTYNLDVTQAQADIWTLLSRIHELEEGIEKFTDWLLLNGAEKDIPDDVWIPFRKLLKK